MDILSFQLVFYGILAVLLTVLGGIIPLLSRWKEAHLHYFVSFSAGVLIATAFLYLLPDALEILDASTAGILILFSFVGLFILEKFIMLHPCEESHCNYHTMGMAAYFGMMVHTFFDGFSLGAAFFVEGLGGIVFLAIMIHKLPSSFSLASILKAGQWPVKKILLFLTLFGLMIPLGALSSLVLLDVIGQKAIGIALALSLGTFIYISTSDFLPEVHRFDEGRFKNLGVFLLGIGMIILLKNLFPFIH